MSAYRQFACWVHVHLGRAVRKVIPACVVGLIRETFPEPSGIYTGYQEADPAAGAFPF